MIGDSIQLHATVVPADAANQNITWSSNKPTIAPVDENGFVRVGIISYTTTVVITATTEDGNYAKKCTLNIKIPNINNYYPAVLKSRRIGDAEWQEGKDANAKYTLNWEYIVGAYTTQPLSYAPFAWQSSDESVLTVASYKDDTTLVYSGNTYRASLAVVQCVGEGTATVTVTNPKYNGISAQRTYTVLRYDPTGITASVASTTLGVGESGMVNVQAIPAATSYPVDLLECTFASSDPAVLGVDATGRFTALAEGSAYITVTYGTLNATTETITISAVEPTDIVINEDEGETIDLYEGEIFQLTVTVLPDNATDKTVTWESSNTAVATVDANGLVTAVSGTKPGRLVRITAKTVNDIETHISFKIKTAPAEPIYYTVTFKDWDENVLKEEQVLRGQAATPPADPVRDGYIFTGWDTDFSYVLKDLVVTALYKLYDSTDIEDIDASSAPRKVLINNVIYILRGDKIYTLQGQEVK